MENKNGQEPAFPFEETGKSNTSFSPGLTKREYFAAMAIQGLIASNDKGAGDRLEDLPKYAVQIADKLLAELTK